MPPAPPSRRREPRGTGCPRRGQNGEHHRGRRPHRRGRDRQRSLRHPHHPLRDRPPRQAGRRLRRRLPGRRDHAAERDDGQQEPQEPLRLLPPDGGRRGAHVRRRPDPRLVLPPRGPSRHRGDPHLPSHRPPAAPVVRRRPAQRDPGRRRACCRSTRRTPTTSWRSTPRRCPPSSPGCPSPARSPACASLTSRAPGSRSPPTTRSSRRPSAWSSRAGSPTPATSRS